MTRRRSLVWLALVAACAAAPFAACSSSREGATTLAREDLLDPVTCGRCHEDHLREWSGSMHAYAGEDPIFLAMNRRLQRETNGVLGDFCVRCHAPLAVRDGKTKDGLDLAELPAKYRGVTCYFCHTVEGVGELHNNGLLYVDEPVMRGPLTDPVPNGAHRSVYSKLHDQRALDSSSMCGSCHDIVTPGGAHIERTFAEWSQSLFATETGQTCGACHMRPSAGLQPVANAPGVFARSSHSHAFAGIDRALTPFSNLAEQKREIASLLDASIQASLCVRRAGSTAQARVILDNVFAGHSFPSGASADRRVWVELIATKQGKVVYQTGVVADGAPVAPGPHDPDLWLLRDRHFDAAGETTHLFGLTRCYESRLLPFPVTANPADPRFYQRNVVREFPADGSSFPLPDSISARVLILPVGLEVLDDLIASGDLDPALRGRMETMQIGPTMTWQPGAATPFVERETGAAYECVTRTNQNYRASAFPPPVEDTCRR